MKLSNTSAATLAVAAATLFLSGAAPAFAAGDAAMDAKGHCMGANACKGKGACKTAKNDCGGKNACKGQGMMESTAAECAKIEGAKFEAAAAPADEKMEKK